MSGFFKSVYPWQHDAWQRLTANFPDVSHALLFAGSHGTGKQFFVEAFASWVLCQNKDSMHNDRACGECQSCLWMQAGTHPNYLHVTKHPDSKSDTIKVDDVRKILPFAQQSSSGTRVIFIEKAERMNVSAANALLKTLEEPPKDVLFLLTSDKPQQLLPTIHSRVQSQQISHVNATDALDYVNLLASYQSLVSNHTAAPSAEQLLAMVGGAPLLIDELLQSDWMSQRQTWIKVWQALRSGQRDVITASQFWQKQLDYDQACELQLLMCRDVLALINDIPIMQLDMNFASLQPLPNLQSIQDVQHFLVSSQQALKQNTQVSYLYDKLMQLLADC